MIDAVIFDMDGLLIDSEPLWMQTEFEIFKKLGFVVTDKIREKTYGLPVNEITEYFYKIKPWKDYNPAQIRSEIFSSVEKRIREEGKSFPGTEYILDFFKNKKIKTGLASASPQNIIDSALSRLNIIKYFDVIHSGDTEEYGKPHPAVFLSTAKKLGIKPVNCLVFEDSLYGIIAAKAALMNVVAVPGKNVKNNPKLVVADQVISSLNDFTEKHFEILATNH